MNLHQDQEGGFPCRSLIASEVLCEFPSTENVTVSFVGGGVSSACFPGNWKKSWERFQIVQD